MLASKMQFANRQANQPANHPPSSEHADHVAALVPAINPLKQAPSTNRLKQFVIVDLNSDGSLGGGVAPRSDWQSMTSVSGHSTSFETPSDLKYEERCWIAPRSLGSLSCTTWAWPCLFLLWDWNASKLIAAPQEDGPSFAGR